MMNSIRTTAAAFAIFIGLCLLVIWAMFLFTGQVLELNTRPVETTLHLTAEVLTAFLLIAAGASILTQQFWAKEAYLVAMGMLLYSAIQAAGTFAQRGQIAYAGMFAIFAVLTVTFTILIFFDSAKIAETSQVRRRKAW
jgi:hypothetical protein